MIIDHINPHYEIRLKDIDPDTGIVYRDIPIAMTTREDYAKAIQDAMNKSDEEPNREYYILAKNKRKV